MTPPNADNSQAGTAKTVLRLIRGNPTLEELGAVVTLLAARSAAGDEHEEAPPTPSQWVSRADLLRRPLPHGAGAWKASAFRT